MHAARGLSFGDPPLPVVWAATLTSLSNKIILSSFVISWTVDQILQELKLHKYITAAQYKLLGGPFNRNYYNHSFSLIILILFPVKTVNLSAHALSIIASLRRFHRKKLMPSSTSRSRVSLAMASGKFAITIYFYHCPDKHKQTAKKWISLEVKTTTRWREEHTLPLCMHTHVCTWCIHACRRVYQHAVASIPRRLYYTFHTIRKCVG